MADKILAGIIRGISTTVTIIILLLAWGAISNGLRQVDPNNPVLGQVVDNSDKAIQETISWQSVIGDIEDWTLIIGLIVGIGFLIIKAIDKFQPQDNYF